LTMDRKILLLQTRNLGDNVIGTALAESLGRGLPTAQIDALTRPEMRSIYSNNPGINKVYTGRFPTGTMRDFGVRDMLLLLPLLLELRRQRYTDVVNLAGDFREELLGRVVCPGDNWSPAWSDDHPSAKINRRPSIRIASRPVPLDARRKNIYSAVEAMGEAMGSTVNRRSALFDSQKEKIEWNPMDRAVGIHPTASQPGRIWPIEKWQEVVERLVEGGMDVSVFGAPAEAAQLRAAFGHLEGAGLKIQTGDIAAFFASLSRMQVLLCHDSFAAHAAYALGVPIVFLNGSNDAEAWAPPGARVLACGPGMSCYPCYNRPTCIGSLHQFGCIRRISIDSVMSAVGEKAAWPVSQRR